MRSEGAHEELCGTWPMVAGVGEREHDGESDDDEQEEEDDDDDGSSSAPENVISPSEGS